MTTQIFTERQFEEALAADLLFLESDELVIDRVATFEDRCLLTRNRGLVIRLDNGAEFQVTIVQSKRADNEPEEEDEDDE